MEDRTILPRRSSKFGKGYVRDEHVGHDKTKDPSIRHLLGAHSGAPFRGASLEQFIHSVWDQRTSSACTGFAFGRAAHVRLLRIAYDAGIDPTSIPRPSATAIYTAGRAADRASPNDPLVDEGAAPNQIVRGMATQGTPADAVWPPGGFDAAYDDTGNPDFVNEEPDLVELEAASTFVLQGFYRIQDGTDQTVADVCHALDAGYPVPVGVEVDQAFEDQDGAGVCQPCGPDVLGGHMLCVVGYRMNKRGEPEFRVCNSWGPGWADNGLFWGSAAWLKSASDCYAITVTPK